MSPPEIHSNIPKSYVGHRGVVAHEVAARSIGRREAQVAHMCPLSESLSPARIVRLLSALESGKSYVASCRIAGVSRTIFYYHRDKDVEFAKAVKEAYHAGTLAMEDEARRRGTDGVDRHVIYKGQYQYRRDPETGELLKDDKGRPVPITVKEYSDILLIFCLKARDRMRYADSDASMERPTSDMPLPPSDAGDLRFILEEKLSGINKRLVMERTTTRIVIEGPG